MHVYICVCTYLFTLRYYTQRCNMLLDTMNKRNNILDCFTHFWVGFHWKIKVVCLFPSLLLSSLLSSIFASFLLPCFCSSFCSELSTRSYFDIGTENLLQLSHPFNSDQYGQSPKSYWTMTIMKLAVKFSIS